MLKTYKGRLQGDRIHWISDRPSKDDAEVLVTIADDEDATPSQTDAEAAIAAFKRLASMNAFADIEDPVAWQREIRKDRPLPGRE